MISLCMRQRNMIEEDARSPLRGGPTGRHDKQDDFFGPLREDSIEFAKQLAKRA